MFAYLQGNITFKDPAYVIIEINGAGYECKISLNTYAALKDIESVKLYTYLHIKEDAHTLYGFYNFEEKETFIKLINISGVGPNTALMILSSLTGEDLKQAVRHEDIKTIQAIKGIGAKSAQRIVLELKDKFKKDDLATETSGISTQSYNSNRNEALSALLTLGFTNNSAENILDKIIKANGENFTTEELIKKALKST